MDAYLRRFEAELRSSLANRTVPHGRSLPETREWAARERALESVWKIGLRWGFVWGLAVIQALDVDRAEPWPDGQDREEDQALLV